MPDDANPSLNIDDPFVSRRGFTLSVAAGAAAVSAANTAFAAAEVVETDVVIKTADGECDAALYHPAGKGPWPGVVIFADAMGLRPAFRDMGKRLAADGYTVLVPNPFYRSRKAPVLPADFTFGKPEDMAKLAELRKPMTVEATTRDSVAYVAYLDKLPVVKTKAKMGVVGYCMGGPMVMQASAASAARIGASCSFHGGGLVTDKPDSPHLLVPKIKAAFYFGVATNDDQKQPDAKVKLKEAFEAVKRPATVEVYEGANHGWCVKDGVAYNEAQAERAWSNMQALYKSKLV